MRRLRSAVLALALALSAGCGWTPRQYVLASAATATLALDWEQTRGIAALGKEENPLIGDHGQNVAPDVYFPLVIVANLILANGLGSYRDDYLASLTGVEAATVYDNAIAGF